MYKVFILVAILLTSVSLAAGSCGGPRAIEPISDEEKGAMVEIAMENPEVSKWLEEADEYSTEVGWVVIAWEGSKVVGWYWMDYEDIKDGTPPAEIAYVTDDITISPELYFHIGEPARMFISVIFDSDKERILSVQLQPGRPSAGPSRS